MKIVNRQTFMSLPENTVYSNYEPCYFGPLSIKQESIRDIDFYTIAINDAILSDSSEKFVDILTIAEKEGLSIKLDFDCCGRDGMFDKNQLFAVWEDNDIVQLIKRLLCCIKDGPKKEAVQMSQNSDYTEAFIAELLHFYRLENIVYCDSDVFRLALRLNSVVKAQQNDT